MAQLGDRPKVRIIRMRKVPFIDSTGIHNLTVLCEMSQKEKTTVILSGVNNKVHQVLEKSGFYELLGKDNICPNINVALERAKSLVKFISNLQAIYTVRIGHIDPMCTAYMTCVLDIYIQHAASISPTNRILSSFILLFISVHYPCSPYNQEHGLLSSTG